MPAEVIITTILDIVLTIYREGHCIMFCLKSVVFWVLHVLMWGKVLKVNLLSQLNILFGIILEKKWHHKYTLFSRETFRRSIPERTRHRRHSYL